MPRCILREPRPQRVVVNGRAGLSKQRPSEVRTVRVTGEHMCQTPFDEGPGCGTDRIGAPSQQRRAGDLADHARRDQGFEQARVTADVSIALGMGQHDVQPHCSETADLVENAHGPAVVRGFDKYPTRAGQRERTQLDGAGVDQLFPGDLGSRQDLKGYRRGAHRLTGRVEGVADGLDGVREVLPDMRGSGDPSDPGLNEATRKEATRRERLGAVVKARKYVGMNIDHAVKDRTQTRGQW